MTKPKTLEQLRAEKKVPSRFTSLDKGTQPFVVCDG